MDSSFNAVQRLLLAVLPEALPVADGGAPLDQVAVANEAPRLVSAGVIEGTSMRAHRILGTPDATFTAFLDGTQRSEVVAYVLGAPLVLGTVAGVIRQRRNRRLVTWRHRVERRLYVSRPHVSPGVWAKLSEHYDVRDTAKPGVNETMPISPHPFALSQRAVHLVQRDREGVERRLAEEWCGVERSPLFVDGGISGSERVARSSCAVGVVKSHLSLYAEGEALQTVLRLRAGHRSSVFRVTSTVRSTVASWYLRLRDASGHDPLWGLVRVETADPTERGAAGEEISARADEVSRWVLAEVTPLALPDGRWDKMAYGIRDCEEFLRAIC
jgi:hypothetical protein